MNHFVTSGNTNSLYHVDACCDNGQWLSAPAYAGAPFSSIVSPAFDKCGAIDSRLSLVLEKVPSSSEFQWESKPGSAWLAKKCHPYKFDTHSRYT